ncbi:hypothetical protein EV421DRAFT_1908255 [Armillaria borealis]|uniref:NACHT domain-containing protein n=1 Tax=Armillaria borealis TaxID=47425 RepID=A0AA39J5Z7_9AGAR|nr:hypothetical protein EV421DRAFT_1908255 [Armillaria borealis]
MAEALGVASSIVALVDVSWTIFKYLKDVKEAPKERTSLSTELSGLVHLLDEVKLFTETAQPNDPWLATMQRLSGPVVQLTALLEDLKKEFKLTPSDTTEKVIKPDTNKVKSRLLGKVEEVKSRLSWTFRKESVEDALKKIERIKSLMIVAVQHDHFALSQAINEMLAIVDTKMDGILDSTNRVEQVTNCIGTNILEVRSQVAHINDGVSQQRIQMQKAQDEETLMRVIAWLTDLNFKSIQAEKLSQRVGNTGRWFLESNQFQKWVYGSATSSCLWCPGNPGVGKTILAAIVIDYLRLLNHERKTLVLSIFCDYQSATTQTIPNLLCSLLKQLVQDNGLSDPITSLYNECLHDEAWPSLDVLPKILSQELESFSRVYIVLDALDEFADDKQEELIEKIRLLGDNIYLLVTSREIPKIGRLFEEDAKLDIRATDADIIMFILDKLSRGNLANLIDGHDNLYEAILTGVTEKAKGMVLLASLHMDSLAQSTNRKILRDTLKELPDNMKNGYDETMERINHQGKHKSALAIRIFGWIVFARHPLTVLELQHALAVELGTTTLDHENIYSTDLLGSVCGGLVIIDPIVRFVHYTTQEYFISQKDNLFSKFQETITCTCLTYMLFKQSHDLAMDTNANTMEDMGFGISHPHNGYHPNIPNSDEYGYEEIPCGLLEMYPFLYYSFIYWGYHANKVQHSMEDRIIEFLDLACCSMVEKIVNGVRFAIKKPIPLQLAVDYGLLHITEVLLNRGDNPMWCDPPLLVMAIERGNLEMVKLLLDRDEIDPNTTPAGSLSLLPLQSACACGDKQILKKFLQSEQVDVNFQSYGGPTALMMAVHSCYISSVEALLKHPRIDIWARDHWGRTAYTYALGEYQKEPDCSDDKENPMIALLEKFGGRPPKDYEPTYPTTSWLPSEQSNSNYGFRIPLVSTTFPGVEDLTGPPLCYDTNGHPIYIGSAIFKGAVLPCKIQPHLYFPCRIPFRGQEIIHKGCYDLLPFNPNTMEFIQTSGGYIPHGRRPVKGGHDQGGSPLYHIVVEVNGMRIPASISCSYITSLHTGFEICTITWDGVEHKLFSFDYYEVLCVLEAFVTTHII